MCAIEAICRQTLPRCPLATILCWLIVSSCQAADEDAVAGMVLWDTQRVAGSDHVDFSQKKSWQQIAAGAAAQRLSGDVVIENERLAVVFSRRSAGPLICPKSAIAERKDRSGLVPLAAGGEPATVPSAIAIRNNDEGEVALEVSSRTATQGVPGRETCVVYRLARGQAFLECKPVANAAAIRIEAGMSFAVIPDFFGADMVFDPRVYAQSNLIIPPENFVLGLLDGENTIVMSVWPAADQDATLALAGARQDRRISAMETGFHGKSVYVAVLHAPGIWHEHRLSRLAGGSGNSRRRAIPRTSASARRSPASCATLRARSIT
jgi:hypothetical protein